MFMDLCVKDDFTFVRVVFLFDFFFFKQKTAYDMRSSDWSSDVCSSDLVADEEEFEDQQAQQDRQQLPILDLMLPALQQPGTEAAEMLRECRRDRKSVV